MLAIATYRDTRKPKLVEVKQVIETGKSFLSPVNGHNYIHNCIVCEDVCELPEMNHVNMDLPATSYMGRIGNIHGSVDGASSVYLISDSSATDYTNKSKELVSEKETKEAQVVIQEDSRDYNYVSYANHDEIVFENGNKLILD